MGLIRSFAGTRLTKESKFLSAKVKKQFQQESIAEPFI